MSLAYSILLSCFSEDGALPWFLFQDNDAAESSFIPEIHSKSFFHIHKTTTAPKTQNRKFFRYPEPKRSISNNEQMNAPT